MFNNSFLFFSFLFFSFMNWDSKFIYARLVLPYWYLLLLSCRISKSKFLSKYYTNFPHHSPTNQSNYYLICLLIVLRKNMLFVYFFSPQTQSTLMTTAIILFIIFFLSIRWISFSYSSSFSAPLIIDLNKIYRFFSSSFFRSLYRMKNKWYTGY
jgi:hypothetical protein